MARLTRWVVVAAVIAAAVAGCSAVPDSGPPPSAEATRAEPGLPAIPAPESSRLAAGEQVPSFDGPFAGAFAAAYRDSTTDLQREVLEDGVLSGQEVAAVHDDYRGCVEARGFSEVTFYEDGRISVRLPTGVPESEASAIDEACMKSTLGSIDLLYTQVRINPDNEDMATLVAQCLVREGLAPTGFTRDQFVQGSQTNSLPFDMNDPRFAQCNTDPLGRL